MPQSKIFLITQRVTILVSFLQTFGVITLHQFHFSGLQPNFFDYLISLYRLFTLLSENEAGTACDHITLNSERLDGSYLQIVVQKDVLDCISSY